RLPNNVFSSPGVHTCCRGRRFTSPGVHAWETRSHRLISLLQEASSAALAKPPLRDIKKPHKWGSEISRPQRVPGVNAWASGKAPRDHIEPPRQKTFTGLFQSTENRFRNLQSSAWLLCVFVMNLL